MILWNNLVNSGYTESIFLFLGFFIIASVIDFLMKKYGEKLSDSEGISWSKVCQIAHSPTYTLLILTGLFLALETFSFGGRFHLWVSRSFFMVTTLLVAYMLSKVSSVLIGGWLKVHRRYEKTPELINKIVAIIIYLVAILVILDHFSIEITPVIATLGVGGIAIGLALQDTLKDFFAGIHIISDRPIRVGDHVDLEGAANLAGYVQDIGWRSTRIKTSENNYIVVPNSKLAASTILNHSMPQRDLYYLVEVGVDYGSDLEEVEKASLEAAQKAQEAVDSAPNDFEPMSRWKDFGDSNIMFDVVMGLREYRDRFALKNTFFKELHKAYGKEGIEISWPIRKIYDRGDPSQRKKMSDKRKKSKKQGGKKKR